MAQDFRKILLAVALLATCTTGCASTDDYKKFAEAGNNFAKANNTLLDIAEDIAVNTTSERVLSQRIGQGVQPTEDIKIFTKRYEDNFSKSDIERLELIKELRKHNQLLFTYFNKLIDLADSDSSARTKTAVESIAGQLQASGNKLISFNKIGKLPSVTKIVLDARIRGTIRDELEKRKDTIYREITIQKELLYFLSESMEQDVKLTRQFQEARLVIQPLFVPSDKIEQDKWIQTRNRVMKQDSGVILTINQASESLEEFRDTFIASVEGEKTSKRIDKFMKETNSFSELVLNNQ